jgi:hypothetical protein
MSSSSIIEADAKYQGTIEYAVVTESKQGHKQLEVGVTLTHRMLGDKVESSEDLEEIPETSAVLWLHLDEQGSSAETRRGIARTHLEAITGQRVEDNWTIGGYLRLAPDHPKSLVPLLEGKVVQVKAREYNSKFYYDLYFPRKKPAHKSLAELRKEMTPY